ncbi:MAG: hypothetical protein UT65_C0020G0011 [Parcubacteria group bacterium GW2011_GWF2_39_8b]|nr:MAG: hypothetical protein UT65_C0020G0011 [Parcubacteria group bacterium GW2011_GWF2_39_8b]KKR45353.1 MAG: hypothetical protein UT81_C0015G0011 [Parcubacteria group bacterium GW2011_GWA2_40_14]
MNKTLTTFDKKFGIKTFTQISFIYQHLYNMKYSLYASLHAIFTQSTPLIVIKVFKNIN